MSPFENLQQQRKEHDSLLHIQSDLQRDRTKSLTYFISAVAATVCVASDTIYNSHLFRTFLYTVVPLVSVGFGVGTLKNHFSCRRAGREIADLETRMDEEINRPPTYEETVARLDADLRRLRMIPGYRREIIPGSQKKFTEALTEAELRRQLIWDAYCRGDITPDAYTDFFTYAINPLMQEAHQIKRNVHAWWEFGQGSV